jgi:KUP system potassium uptake protein
MDHNHQKTHPFIPILGALGIVFGDIGTSPLYALQDCFGGKYNMPFDSEHIMGVASLFFWFMTLSVSLKYVIVLMRFDNQGEGGIMSLFGLIPGRLTSANSSHKVGILTLLAIFGASLLLGDGVITPSISVLSAMEGLAFISPKLTGSVVPLTCLILFLLFSLQKGGTQKIGKYFGPVMMVWFSTLFLLGLTHIIKAPQILYSLSPYYALNLVVKNPLLAFKLLGSIILCITGGEALYADMGHCGRPAIQKSWFFIVYPSIITCYMGQTAFLLDQGHLPDHMFYAMAPSFSYFLVFIATFATIIASQSLITGAFSLTYQSIQLGFLPLLNVKHTSKDEQGQIYIPFVNWFLMIACMALVLLYQKSEHLVEAYGLSVSGTMFITSILFIFVLKGTKYSFWIIPYCIVFWTLDGILFSSNLIKFFHGGYIPVVIGIFISTIMFIWYKGKKLLIQRYNIQSQTWDDKISDALLRTPEAAVVLSSEFYLFPPALFTLSENLKILPKNIFVVKIVIERQPFLSQKQRFSIIDVGQGLYQVIIHYGFLEKVNLPRTMNNILKEIERSNLFEKLVYILHRESFVETHTGKLSKIPQSIFAFLIKISRDRALYFHLPLKNVVEVGNHIDL